MDSNNYICDAVCCHQSVFWSSLRMCSLGFIYGIAFSSDNNSLLSLLDMSWLSSWYFLSVEHGRNSLDGEFHWVDSHLISTQGGSLLRNMH